MIVSVLYRESTDFLIHRYTTIMMPIYIGNSKTCSGSALYKSLVVD